MPALLFAPNRAIAPTGGLTQSDAVQIGTGQQRLVFTAGDVVLSLVVGDGPQATLADGTLPGAVLLASQGRGVGLSLDTSTGWPAGDGLVRAALTVTASATSAPAVPLTVPTAFARVASLGNVVVVRVGSAASPGVPQTVYGLTLTLTSRQGGRRTVTLPTILCRS